MALRTSEWWCSGNCHHLCFEKIENSLMKNNTDCWAFSFSHPPQSEKLTKGVPLRLILLWLITIYHICWLPHTTGSSELEYHQNERHKGITSSSPLLVLSSRWFSHVCWIWLDINWWKTDQQSPISTCSHQEPPAKERFLYGTTKMNNCVEWRLRQSWFISDSYLQKSFCLTFFLDFYLQNWRINCLTCFVLGT